MWTVGVVFLAFASGVLAQSCGTTSEVSAGLADATVFPWVGVVYYRNRDDDSKDLYGVPTAVCVLIDKQHVLMSDELTSGSVVEEELYVKFGVTDANDTSSHHKYTVEKISIHPNAFPGTFTNIVVLRLKEPVKFSETVSPVCLPSKDQDFNEDNFYYVSYKLRVTEGDNKKEIIQNPRVEPTDCEELYKNAWSLISPANSASYICIARSESRRLDSISPLLTKSSAGWTAAGLYHFGPRDGGTGLPAAFLDVRLYLDWIRTVVAG